MNAQEAEVPKSPIIAIAAALLAAPNLATAEPNHRPVLVSSGRSVSRDVREAWFRHHVGEILSGRTAIPRVPSSDR